MAPARRDAKAETIASVVFGSTKAMRSCFWMPCSTNRRASDAACSNNSRKEVTRSSSTMAGASGMAAAVCRSQSESRSLSGSGKRHPPSETDPCGCEQQQLPGTNSALAPHIHIIDDEIAGKGVAIVCHGSWWQAALWQSQHLAETLAVPEADVGIDEMVNIVQVHGRRCQNFLHQPEQVEIVDRHYLVFNA